MKKILIALLLFILAELYLMIVLGQFIGPGYAIGYVVFFAVAGYVLAHRCFMIFRYRMIEKIRKRELRFLELTDWGVTLLGAVFLFIPGIISDILGGLLILGTSRQFILQRLWPLIKDSEFVNLLRIRLKEELEKKGFQDFRQ